MSMQHGAPVQLPEEGGNGTEAGVKGTTDRHRTHDYNYKFRFKESKVKDSNSSPYPSCDNGNRPDDFPARLGKLIGDSSVRAFARKAGVSDTFLRQCLAGRTEPTRTKLLALARAGETTVEWLATGDGNRHAAAEAAGPDPGLDRALLESVITAVEQVLGETGCSLSADRKALLVTVLYEMHTGDERTPITRDEVLKLVSCTG